MQAEGAERAGVVETSLPAYSAVLQTALQCLLEAKSAVEESASSEERLAAQRRQLELTAEAVSQALSLMESRRNAQDEVDRKVVRLLESVLDSHVRPPPSKKKRRNEE